MKNFKIGGVPEHFNYPWYTTLKNKKYQQKGINLRWVDYPGGTGQMNKALREKEIDFAVILTEGIVRDIIHGNESKIVQVFVQSPLIWGIHVAQEAPYFTISDLKGKEAAISRYGSGSHLMAYINAKNNSWNLQTDLKFKVIDNLEGALQGLPAGKGDYFMWEKFTTKPYVDQGIFRCIGTCPTPWPCFVIAVRNDVLENEPQAVKSCLDIINAETSQFKSIVGIDYLLSQRYQQKLKDVQQWLSVTHWSQEQLTPKQLKHIQQQLLELNLIDKTLPIEKLIHTF